MGVGLDQARHQRSAARIDVAGVLARQCGAISRDGCDSIALDANLAGEGLRAAAVDDGEIAEDDRVHVGWPSRGVWGVGQFSKQTAPELVSFVSQTIGVDICLV